MSQGLLNEEDGATDLGVLEKRLQEKHQQTRHESQSVSDPTSPSQTGMDGPESTPQSSLTSPEPGKETHSHKDKDADKRKSVTPEKEDEEEVEALSEMMCSLVTNHQGETRYIGKFGS